MNLAVDFLGDTIFNASNGNGPEDGSPFSYRRVEKIEIGSALKIKKRKPYQLVHFPYLTEKVKQVVLLVI